VTIPKSLDKAMDKAQSKQQPAPAGVSIRNGPVTTEKMDVDEPVTNGKRKSRGSAVHIKSYKESDSDEEDVVKPVCLFYLT
jgi:DNA topoisomerase I